MLARHPRVKLLVNNAGISGRGDFVTADVDRIEQVMRTNYLGGVWCLRAFLPGLEAAAPADVVNVVSVSGTVAFGPAGPYSASKHAQIAFSRSTAAQLRPRGVRVHTVNPGFVETEGFPNATTLKSAFFRRVVIGPEQGRRPHRLGGPPRPARDVRPVLVPRLRGLPGRDAEHGDAGSRPAAGIGPTSRRGLHFRR